MSYVQGTKVRLTADFTGENGVPTTPLEVILTVAPPAPAEPFVRTLSGEEVVADEDRPGRVSYVLDTKGEVGPAGTWRYQFESTGNESVVGRKELTVRSRLAL